MPRSGTAGSCGNSICHFLRNFLTVLDSDFISLCFTRLYEVVFSPHCLQIVVCRLFNDGYLTSVGWYLPVGLICISLVISRVKPLFISLLAIFMSSGLCPCRSSAHFLIELFGFFGY